jgi:hypothetical protein
MQGNAYAFILDVLRKMTTRVHKNVINDIMFNFRDDTLAVLKEDEVFEELTCKHSRMPMYEAVKLFYYIGSYSEVYWRHPSTS